MKQHFFVFSVLAVPLVLLQGCCQYGPWPGIRGEGPVVERKLDIRDFKGLTISNSANVYLTQGERFEILVQGQENIIDNLNTDVSGETWRIGFKRPVSTADPLKIHITLSEIRMIKISGSGDVSGTGPFTGLKDLELGISGSGDMDLDVEAADISAHISGSGNIILSGTADDLDFTISGSGGIDAGDLAAGRAETRISGSGGMNLNLTDRLDARISGSGDIYYSGSPKVHSSVSGSGRVRPR